MTQNDDNGFGTDQARMFLMYSDGEQLADIGTAFSVCSTTITKRMKDFPQKLDDAKKKRAEYRNAKYRRIGALAADLLIDSLENSTRIRAAEKKNQEELDDLEFSSIDKDYKGKLKLDEKYSEVTETVYSDGKDPKEIKTVTGCKLDPILKATILKDMYRMDRLKALIKQAGIDRGNTKDPSSVGETSEKRADLNEGKPTERTETNTTLSLEEVKKRIEDAENAGTGLDSEVV
jgi:hypothetical protein